MFDHSGEEIQIEDSLFQGHYVGPFLVSLVESLLEIAQKGTKRFQERYVDLGQDSGDCILVLSYLDGKSIRIALQNRYGRNEHRNPTVEQLVGYAVDFEALTRETIRCGRTFLDYAETAGCRDTSMAKDLAESIGRLELVLRDNGE